MPRFFTLLEAEGFLPEVERLLRSSIQAKQDYESGDSELNQIAQRITLMGGVAIKREDVVASRTRKDSSARVLKAAMERIEEIGCQVKDLETGLIDFPTLYRDREVYLCWKLGESGIRFWHHIEDGFRGRQPINSEFLANHRGGGEAAE
ncbi:MAG: DUF2203 domain-containing protein [Acidobacteriaceae bacterium]|nr:DUF2203 domain-containing protein [Acidobacteriaceae bacterium]MBV9037422.1 DUF2203 domain-containing protein [Acidobacteriaceae bacterium]MBV9223066.1 DUF2203 domain-containing protein [Acidobacteriaceae bacterium]MBV9308721.1 DUF2203 domain-containing protein [Acidobacteriaceae bacterium]MBV9679000.1 DUF2203 domain-containing protein [Acidobacteriaceae bacterium]